MTTEHFDVVVVGGGPAGTTAARIAAEKGAKTLVIEKRQEIGTPVRCGEGMPKSFLRTIGIEPDPEWIAARIKGARLVSPGGHEMYINERMAGSKTGYNIERDLFDKSLARQAVEAGAVLRIKTSATGLIIEAGAVRGVVVKHLGQSVKVRAPVTIGADGFESQIGRWGGIDTTLKPRDITSCLQYRMVGIDCDPEYNTFSAGSMAPGGYLWAFPKGPREANVGLGVSLANLKRQGAGEVKVYLDRFIRSRPEYAKGKVIQIIAGGVSVNAPLDQTVTDGLMLVGDAARMIDPMNGGGLAPACVTGKFAAETALLALSAQDFSAEFFQHYEQAWRNQLEDMFFRNYIAKEKMANMSDEMLDMLVESIKDEQLEELTVLEVLKAVERKHPEFMEELAEFL